ncbi:hypothetical protein [Streptomyces sp. NBC_01304]|uniref:hypothetical protein n=1 Tax=Streptomyces sp. NBC_01304 TaxID=2903818 RepID=UPI002E0EA523|nr:hypothetical protein OG430_24470 [Streptomyces sp. NBC_01304]
MRATRRTLRTSVIAAGVVAGLALPAAAAFADSPTVPDSNKEQVLPGKDDAKKDEGKKDETPKPGGWESKGSKDLGDGWSADVSVNASARMAKAEIALNKSLQGSLQANGKTATAKIGEYTFTLTADGQVSKKKTGGETPKPGSWKDLGTKDLGNGWSANVSVNASARMAKADIYFSKAGKGSLKAVDGKTATTKIDGNTFTLTADGQISMKKGEKPTPDGRTFVREYKNIGGSGFDAKVYKVKGGYDAEMWGKNPEGKYIKWDTLQQRGNKAAYGGHNGAHFVLNPDGTMKGWVEGGKKDQHKKPVAPVKPGTPKGGVKAGAEGVGASDNTELLAAGGGIAAAGAAGLGFAMLRRGREQG